MSTSNVSLTKNEKSLFARCYYVFFVNGALVLMIGAILPYLKESYGLSYQLAGFLVSAHSIGNLISSFIGGILPVYLGRKKSILLFCGCGVLAFIMIIFTDNPWLLILAFLLTGLNRGAVSNFNNTVINEIATGKAWALNLLHSIFAIGAFCAPFIVLFFTRNNHDNWVYAILTMAILAFTQIIILAITAIPNNYPALQKKGETDLRFLSNPYFLTATAILFTYLCAEQAINGWLVTYLKDAGIMNGTFAQIMTSLLWVVILIGRLLTAFVSNYIRKSQLLLFSSIGYIAFFIVLINSRSLIPAAVGIIGVGFFMSGIYPTTLSSIGDIIKENPLALSILLTLSGLGAILMPSVIGLLANKIGIIGGMSSIYAAVIATVVLIFFNSFIRRKK